MNSPVAKQVFEHSGMPVFAGQLTSEELQAIEAFILERAWKAYEAQPAQGHP